MWARVTTFVFPADDVDKAVEQLNHAVDAFLLQPGLSRIDVLVNPRSAAAVTISLWESEEAMKATDDDAEHLRSHIVLEVLGWIDLVSEYELMRTEQVQRGSSS